MSVITIDIKTLEESQKASEIIGTFLQTAQELGNRDWLTIGLIAHTRFGKTTWARGLAAGFLGKANNLPRKFGTIRRPSYVDEHQNRQIIVEDRIGLAFCELEGIDRPTRNVPRGLHIVEHPGKTDDMDALIKINAPDGVLGVWLLKSKARTIEFETKCNVIDVGGLSEALRGAGLRVSELGKLQA